MLYVNYISIKLGGKWQCDKRHTDRYRNQWNSIENSKGNSLIYGQLMFNKDAKIHYWIKDSPTNKWCCNNTQPPAKEWSWDPCFTLYIKINPKWIVDINVRAKTIKLLGRNTGIYLCDLGIGNGILDMTPKAWVTKKQKNWS